MLHTFMGKVLDPFKIQPDDIHIMDICHPLSMICRYGGHSNWFYSVAQHSVLLSEYVPEHLAKVALLHDAAEAYVGDMILPIKHQFPEFEEKVERPVLDAIFDRYHLDICQMEELKPFDRGISINEMDVLMPQVDEYLLKTFHPLDLVIKPWSSAISRGCFMKQFYELFPEERRQ